MTNSSDYFYDHAHSFFGEDFNPMHYTSFIAHSFFYIFILFSGIVFFSADQSTRLQNCTSPVRVGAKGGGAQLRAPLIKNPRGVLYLYSVMYDGVLGSRGGP